MFLPQSLSRRDGVFILTGASVVYIIYSLAYYGSPAPNLLLTNPPPIPQQPLVTIPSSPPSFPSPTAHLDLGVSRSVPETSIIAHAPGWTLFQNLYMSNGTLYIVASNHQTIPEIRMVTSTGLIALNTPENIAAREPTDQEMKVIDPKNAMLRWGGNIAKNERHRISSVEGNTVLVNEPWQFLNHYYHFVAELLLGTWAFIYGAFNPSASSLKSSGNFDHTDATIPSFNLQPQSFKPPPFSRVIFLHASSDEWRDKHGFNSFFLRAAFPSIDVETSEDWNDRVASTSYNHSLKPFDNERVPTERAWHFPVALLSDRSASFRGEACGSKTQRIAAESWELMVQKGGIDLFGGWWSDVRESVLRFAGITAPKGLDIGRSPPDRNPNVVSDVQSLLPLPTQNVITYINRQGVRRHLIPEHHDGLVSALQQMVKRKQEEGKDWVLNIVQPELLTKEDQFQLASETTIMLGVHGNGLTHLVLMNPNRYSSVVEIFYPGGFTHDYEWTTRALGMRHFSVWNDTYFTYPNEPPLPSYPEGFQGTAIPVHGPTVAKLIEDRLEGKLEF